MLDKHLAITTPYAGQNAAGFPDDEWLDRLRSFEDGLTDRVGDRGLLVAHQSSRGVRTFHLYLDQTDHQTEQLARDIAATWPDAGVKSTVDPGWSRVAMLAHDRAVPPDREGAPHEAQVPIDSSPVASVPQRRR